MRFFAVVFFVDDFVVFAAGLGLRLGLRAFDPVFFTVDLRAGLGLRLGLRAFDPVFFTVDFRAGLGLGLR